MNRIDAGYRSLICAIIIRAVRDVQEGRDADEARAFLVSPECKRLALLASIRWMVDEGDIDQAVQRLGKRRTRQGSKRARKTPSELVSWGEGDHG
jgi:hypothetical protein